MSLQVITASTDQDLTTTGRLRRMIYGATATATQDGTVLSDAIRDASRWAQTHIGYPFAGVATYRETVASQGRRSLMLSRTPVLAVKALYDTTDTGLAQVLTTQVRLENSDAGIITRDQGFAWSASLMPPGAAGPFYPSGLPLDAVPLPGQETRPWLVDYVAGYTYDGLTTDSANWSTAGGSTSTGRTLPEDIERGVLYKAQGYVIGEDEVESEKLGDLAVNYRSLGNDGGLREGGGRLRTRAIDVLEPYRRVA